MDSRWLGGIALVIILALGGWYIFSHPTRSAAPAPETATSTEAMSSTTAPVLAPVTVTYTDQGFSPASVTIAEGQTVIWVNKSSQPLWVASNPHPTHTAYDGTSRTTHCAASYTGLAPFDECAEGAPGSSWNFTFGKAGTWGYHDHLDHAMTGTIIVTAAAPAPGTGEKGGDTGASASTSVNVQVQ
ncbi:MAG: hypothetical protein KGI78_03100 [Patescibacteria group bacterium]|nr:hypothetical protein [Patescibacteria group bacterium]MDE1944239.1 hypothetical protein [Patescibacteria group bacterium]MDE1945325.1 hypothetical protein [Patescibacteria group bacterium]MDE2057817.1 hypothetical protein [Patescibacteria group bacterium]